MHKLIEVDKQLVMKLIRIAQDYVDNRLIHDTALLTSFPVRAQLEPIRKAIIQKD